MHCPRLCRLLAAPTIASGSAWKLHGTCRNAWVCAKPTPPRAASHKGWPPLAAAPVGRALRPRNASLRCLRQPVQPEGSAQKPSMVQACPSHQAPGGSWETSARDPAGCGLSRYHGVTSSFPRSPQQHLPAAETPNTCSDLIKHPSRHATAEAFCLKAAIFVCGTVAIMDMSDCNGLVPRACRACATGQP